VELTDERPGKDGVPFVGDEQRVRQILVNLLSNAVKFTESGGRVTISCGVEQEAPPEAQLQGAGAWAFLRVTDTGIGIAPEQVAHIFDPFHQVDSTHTRAQGGTGLGLAISRRLARLMSGDLTVESTPEVGSTFTLWLPSAKAAASPPPRAAPHASAPPSAKEAPTATSPLDLAVDRATSSEESAEGLETRGLDEVGNLVRGLVDEVIVAYTERLRADPATPRARRMRRPELEDHGLSLLADIAQTLLIISEAGREAAELLRDGSTIQRTIAERHGNRRHAQGWTENAVRRDHQLLREELERAVRVRLRNHPRADSLEEAVQLLLRLVTSAEALSVAAWRRAAEESA
jgi:histidine kinase/DNA gyrase B/HSP90-like ATPase